MKKSKRVYKDDLNPGYTKPKKQATKTSASNPAKAKNKPKARD